MKIDEGDENWKIDENRGNGKNWKMGKIGRW